MSEVESAMASRPQEYRRRHGFLNGIARTLVLRQLERLGDGQLHLTERGTTRSFGTPSDEIGASITVKDPRFYSGVAIAGAVGAAEAYMRGWWVADDLTEVVRVLVRNREVLEGMEGGAAQLTAPVRRLLHWIHRNTKNGSRRNIAAHYDLGNEFFKLWLDETMMYSSAVFEDKDMTLTEASTAKLDRICRKLALTEDDHVLEIGTGWGGFAVHAASNYGCRVTTTTISKEQYEYARSRIEKAGLKDKVTLLMDDYRDLDGLFDKLVSIEMVEAVGHKFLDEYFTRCARLLKPQGMMLMQAITIADQHYESAIKSVDFIQRYIFPGGFLPSVTRLLDAATNSSDMRVYHLEDIGAHYARTLRAWKEQFWANIDRVRALGYGKEFQRMWHYYYCYCEGAFMERAIGNVQVLFVKPGCRREPLVPSLAAIHAEGIRSNE